MHSSDTLQTLVAAPPLAHADSVLAYYTDEDVLFCEDSIFNAPDQALLPNHTTLFRNHTLKPIHATQVERAGRNDGGYVFGVLMLLTIVLLVFSLMRKIELKKCIMSAFSMRHTNILIRESRLKSDLSLWPLPFIYYTALGILGYVALTRIFEEKLYGMLDLPILIGAFLLFSFLRYLLTKLLGVACNGEEPVSQYLISGSLFQQIGVAVLIPLTIVGCYVEKEMIWVAVATAAVVFVLRLSRGLAIVLSRSRDFKLYLFYYLCIVEIIPILILAKIIISYEPI